jgi:hypothetical protein
MFDNNRATHLVAQGMLLIESFLFLVIYDHGRAIQYLGSLKFMMWLLIEPSYGELVSNLVS